MAQYLSHMFYKASESFENVSSAICNSGRKILDSRICKIAKSYCAKKLGSMILENAAEATAYYGIGSLASSAGVQVGRALGTTLFIVTAAPLSAVTAHASEKLLNLVPAYKKASQNFLIRALSCSLIFAATYQTLDGTYGRQMEEIGIIIGNNVAQIAVGTIAANFAIRRHGSDEKLYNPEDHFDSYPVKTLQCLAADEVANFMEIIPENPIAGFVIGQVIGSLSFNARDLGQLSLKAFNGELFEGVLDASLKFEILDQQKSKTLLAQGIDKFSRIVINKMTHQLFNHSNTTLALFLQSFKDLLPTESLQIETQEILDLSVNEDLIQFTNIFLSQLMQEAINLYFAIDQRASLPAKALFEMDKLSEQFDLSMAKAVIEQLQVLQSDHPVWELILKYLGKDAEKKSLFQSVMNQFLQITKPSKIEPIVDFLEKQLIDMEESLFGIHLQSEATRLENKKLIHQLLWGSAKLLPIALITLIAKNSVSRGKTFYTNIVEFFEKLYSMKSENLVVSFLNRFISHQINGLRED